MLAGRLKVGSVRNSKIQERWELLTSGNAAAIKGDAEPPVTIRCPVCGSKRVKIVKMDANFSNDHKRLESFGRVVGFGLEYRTMRCNFYVACVCGAETEMMVKQTERMI